MNEAIQKFKEMLGRVETVRVLMGTTENLSKILAGHILHQTFLQLGKRSSLSPEVTHPKYKQFLEKLAGPLALSKIKEQLAITIDTSTGAVSELKYEKGAGFLKIVLQTEGVVSPEHVVAKKESAPVDLLVLVDTSEPETASLVQKIPHRDVVKLSSKNKALPLKVAEIVLALLETPSAEIRDCLWHLIDRGGYEAVALSAEMLDCKQKLLALGVRHNTIAAAVSDLKGSSFWKLVGRALARSEIEKDIGAIWSFIPLSDLRKTNQDETVMPLLLEELFALRPEGNWFALLWEHGAHAIQAAIGCRDTEKLHEAAGMLGGSVASSYFMVDGFATFSEAELAIRSSLRKVL